MTNNGDMIPTCQSPYAGYTNCKWSTELVYYLIKLANTLWSGRQTDGHTEHREVTSLSPSAYAGNTQKCKKIL